MSSHNTKYYNPVTNEVLPKEKWVEWAHSMYAMEGQKRTDEHCWKQLTELFKLEEVEVH